MFNSPLATISDTQYQIKTIIPTVVVDSNLCPDWVYSNQGYSENFWINLPKSKSPNNYIGFQYRLLPSLLKEEFSVLILGDSSITYYGLSLIKDGEINLIWFDKAICRYKDQAYYEVIDVVEIPNMLENDILIIGNVCSINGLLDYEIVVITDKESSSLQTKIKKAWRANRTSNQFEVIPTNGITCITDWAKE